MPARAGVICTPFCSVGILLRITPFSSRPLLKQASLSRPGMGFVLRLIMRLNRRQLLRSWSSPGPILASLPRSLPRRRSSSGSHALPPTAKLMTSVCTGAFLLAQAGLLTGKRATTHWAALDQFEHQFPQIQVQRTEKFVDEGPILTAAALTAGFQMALHVVERLLPVVC